MTTLSATQNIQQARDFYAFPDHESKLAALDGALNLCFAPGLAREPLPAAPARSMPIVAISRLPDKPGLSTLEGQARLAHDLASIELQATELALRTLIEFPDAPAEFRSELAELARSEGAHLRLCVQALDRLGRAFGDWPVHVGLWQATSADDSLIDRVIIVHRYLEGAGLDASETLLRRLSGVADLGVRQAIEVIAREEVGHVAFGSRWLKRLCAAEGLDPEAEFEARLARLTREAPRRERLARETRKLAGFTDREMDAIEGARRARS